MSTSSPSVAEYILVMIGLIVCACLLARLRKPSAPVHDERLHRHHRSIQERQRLSGFRPDGYTRLQVIAAIAAILGAHALMLLFW